MSLTKFTAKLFRTQDRLDFFLIYQYISCFTEGQQTNKRFREEKDKLQNQMKAKDLLNNLMAEKEVSVEKDGEGVVISYEGIHVSYEYEGKCVNVNRFFVKST